MIGTKASDCDSYLNGTYNNTLRVKKITKSMSFNKQTDKIYYCVCVIDTNLGSITTGRVKFKLSLFRPKNSISLSFSLSAS